MTDLPRTEHACHVCGRPAVYHECDLCWEGFLRETADRHAKAIARQEGDRPEGKGEWTWNDGD